MANEPDVDVVLICGDSVSGDGSNYCSMYGGWAYEDFRDAE